VKLFGSACRSEPAEVMSKFDRFALFLFSALQSGDVDSGVVSVAVETVGFIGSTTRGKHALHQQGLLIVLLSLLLSLHNLLDRYQ